jgi:hypothetical protein
MFGTIRLNPDHRTSDFVKSADGDLYGQLGGKLPRHRACDRCRAKKVIIPPFLFSVLPNNEIAALMHHIHRTEANGNNRQNAAARNRAAGSVRSRRPNAYTRPVPIPGSKAQVDDDEQNPMGANRNSAGVGPQQQLQLQSVRDSANPSVVTWNLQRHRGYLQPDQSPGGHRF